MSQDLPRRALLAAPAVLAAATAACAQQTPEAPLPKSDILVAYFTRSGNTRVVAGTLQRLLEAELFEIRPATPYPGDYEETVSQATREREAGFRPPLAALAPDVADYRTILLGFPIWGMSVPPIIRTFLATHNLRGKTLRPFITHGGYGLGDSLSVLSRDARGARMEPPFSMEADQERRTLNTVRAWIA